MGLTLWHYIQRTNKGAFLMRTLNLPHEISVTVAQPYKEGYVLTAAEAEKLNQVFADSIRTSLMSKLKKLKKLDNDSVDHAEVEHQFQQFANNYAFSIRTPKNVADPVAKEAHKIAKEQVFASIRKKGGNPTDYSAEQIAEYVTKVLQHKPEIMEEAARRIDSSRKIAGDLLDDLLDEAA